MPRTLRISSTYKLTNENITYGSSRDIVADNPTESYPTVAAAKPGDLTARTSTSAGTLVMDGGHGFVTGNLIDIFGTWGKRVGVILGVNTGDSFSITGGSGDDLPTVVPVETNAMLRHAEDRVFTGDDAQWILINSPVAGWVTFTQTDGTTVIVSIPLTVDQSGSNFTYSWDIENDPTGNPLAGAAVGKILFSHGSLNAQDMRVVVGTN